METSKEPKEATAKEVEQMTKEVVDTLIETIKH